MASLSQQLREALAKMTPPELYAVNGASAKNGGSVYSILEILPFFLTEHEALQRKADAGEALLVCVDNHSCDGQGDCWVSMDAFVTAYHEATKLPDV